MRRAEHDVHRVRAASQNRGHGVDHDFNALVGREQTESQDDGSAAEA